MARFVLFVPLLTLLAGLVSSSPAHAGDWPQILGPQRNGVAEGEKLAAAWPKSGPPVVWQREVGSGFAGPAIAAGKLVLFHRVDGNEVIEGLDAKSGKPLWKQAFPSGYAGGIAPDNGPRCVPLLHGGNVYVYGAAGELHSVTLDKGEKRWSRSLLKDYAGDEGYFGAGSTPIIAGDKLLINVGGKGAGIVALDTATGKEVWKGTSEGASYSSPTLATIDGTPAVIFITRLNLLAIDPVNGTVFSKTPFGQRGPTVNGANPLFLDGHLFATASYGIGALWAKLTKDSITPVWANDDAMSSQYPTPVPHDGYLYGIDGRDDIGVAKLRAIDPRTGKVAWTVENFGMASTLAADGKLLLLKTDGTLVLADASPKKFAELGSFAALRTTARALPALSGGLFYARDTETLKCWDVGVK